jgi:ATP:ADP antiporter, AAA family
LSRRDLTRPEDGLAYRLLRRVIAVEPEEAPLLLWCWLFIFSVMSSYSVMRPIRDQAGVAGGVRNLPWLFTGTLVGMVLVNIPFAWIVKKLPRSRFIPLTYHFFAFNIVLFAVALHLAGSAQAIWVGRVFFIWVSVFNLFVVSVFWQMNVDLFTAEQGKRLFGFIAAGAEIGALAGAAMPAGLAEYVPAPILLLVSAALLEIAVFSVGRLSRLAPSLHRRPAATEERPIGGGVIGGISHALRSPYLLNVCVFMLLYSLTSTFLYFLQVRIAAHAFTGAGERIAFFARISLAADFLTLLIQLFLTGRLLPALGVAVALVLLPALTIAGFGMLALFPTLAAIVGFQIVRSAANYAIARPTREVLFTVVSREDRFKAKSFIDTVVYRTGDQLGIWSSALLNALGWAASAIPLVAIALSVVWCGNSLWLGRRQHVLEAEAEAISVSRETA